MTVKKDIAIQIKEIDPFKLFKDKIFGMMRPWKPLIKIGLGSYAAYKIFNGSLHGIIKAEQFVNNAQKHARELEFGNVISPGYTSHQAATERQRLLNQLRESSNGPRRNLGKEAHLISGML